MFTASIDPLHILESEYSPAPFATVPIAPLLSLNARAAIKDAGIPNSGHVAVRKAVATSVAIFIGIIDSSSIISA